MGSFEGLREDSAAGAEIIVRMRMILIYNAPPFCYRLDRRRFLPNPRRWRVAQVYVCLCNGFTDGQVRSVCEQQQRRVCEVYKALGCAPKCGKCVPMVRELARVNAPSVAAYAEPAAA